MKAPATILHRVRTLVVKELQSLLSDSTGRRILVMPVLVQVILFPLAATLEVRNATLAVLNQDMGAESIELMHRFATARAFSRFIMLASDRELRETIEGQKALVAIRFPADFSRKLASGETAPLQAILDGRRSNSAQIAVDYIQRIIEDYALARMAKQGRSVPSQLIVRHWFNPNLDFVFSLVPSLIATITTAGTLIVTSLSIAREREQGTFEQLMVSPLTPEMIMIGKAIPAMLIAAFQGTLVLLTAVLVYHIPFEGSLLLLYGSMFFYIAALVGFGLLISSVCSTQQQAFLGVFCFMMPAILLSGFTSPVDNMPEWLQAITWANPLRHFMNVVKSIFLKDVSLLFVVENVWPLAAIAFVTISSAIWMFRHKTA